MEIFHTCLSNVTSDIIALLNMALVEMDRCDWNILELCLQSAKIDDSDWFSNKQNYSAQKLTTSDRNIRLLKSPHLHQFRTKSKIFNSLYKTFLDFSKIPTLQLTYYLQSQVQQVSNIKLPQQFRWLNIQVRIYIYFLCSS